MSVFHKSIEVAELVAGQGEDTEYLSHAAALTGLAGFAASDAACCWLSAGARVWRDHRGAVIPHRADLARRQNGSQLTAAVLNLKDEAHYGPFDVSGQDLKMRYAKQRTW